MPQAQAPAPNAGPYLPLRLHPGDDLRLALQAALAHHGASAAFVVAGIGSLRPTALRLAGARTVLTIDADVELLTLSGSVGVNGCHLHCTVAGPDGAVMGGHVGEGCTVRTTAEITLALLPDWHFSREPDPATGWAELVIRPNRA